MPKLKPKCAVSVHLGQRLRELRKLSGMSQTGLANQIGMTFQQIQKYENGTNRAHGPTLVKIAKALDVPVEELFGKYKNKNKGT